jgi:hypothetical protein
MLSWLRELGRRVKLSSMRFITTLGRLDPVTDWNSRADALGSDDGPRDPYSYVRHPMTERPGGRNAAIALEEPADDQNLQLIGDTLGR